MLSCLNWVSSELCNVFMGSTIFLAILFLFSESEEEKEKAGGRGVVVIELFIFLFFNVNSFLCTVFTIIIIKMQGFVFISFILISLFNARFRFHHHISSFWGGFIVNINKLYDFEMRACFSFPISEWMWMWVHAEVDCFWLILPPFSGWLQKFP